MGRWSVEDDDRQYDEVRNNATCVDCGQDFSRAYDDQGAYCDGCSDHRDAHTDALEIRLASDGQPAKSQPSLANPQPFVDVAIVPVDPNARGPVVEIALEWNPDWDAVRRPVEKPVAVPRAKFFDRLPTLSAVQQSRAGKPFPKKKPSRREVA
jgi:hypothetical protein